MEGVSVLQIVPWHLDNHIAKHNQPNPAIRAKLEDGVRSLWQELGLEATLTHTRTLGFISSIGHIPQVRDHPTSLILVQSVGLPSVLLESINSILYIYSLHF